MPRATLQDLSRLFLKLGIFGFGGPAAHIATMEEEVVQRKRWLSEQEFLDLVGATNLIPGPNSTELAIHIGYQQGGWRGLFLAGSCFIFPAVIITSLFAWLYVEYGQLPQTASLMTGIQPTVLAIILIAGWRLGKKALFNRRLQVFALLVAGVSLYLPGKQVLVLLFSSLIGTLLVKARNSQPSGTPPSPPSPPAAPRATPAMLMGVSTLSVVPGALTSGSGLLSSLAMLGWIFLKTGAVLYGSGYVLIAYLEGELVHQYHWLTENQLIDAIAIGQFTPGPILSTATFIGYVVMAPLGPMASVAGAVIATFAIFLPSFLLVGITSRWVSKLRSHRTLSKFLDAVNAASMGIMGAVVLKLARPTLLPDNLSHSWNITAYPGWNIVVPLDWSIAVRLLIAAGAMTLILRYRVSPILIIAGGLLCGLLLGPWLV